MWWNLSQPWARTGNYYENNTVGENGRAVYGDVFDTYNISVRGKDPSFFNVFDYDRHKNYIRKRVKSTCDWVLQNATFLDWLQNAQSSVMFVTAYPGCGKSVLSRAIVDENIVGSDGYTTLYFFFQDRRKQRTTTCALCSLLHQLFRSHQHLFNKYGQQALKEVGESLKFEFEALWDLFVKASSDPEAGQIVCVLDGLDECEEDGRYDLLHKIKEIYNNMAGKTSENLKLRFFITSRPYPEIDSHLERFPKRYLLRIQDKDCVKSISKDVTKVARKTVKDLAHKKRLPAKVERKIVKQLLRNRQRTYLWITLVCKRIDKQQHLDETDWLSSIERLPQTETVDECYESFLSHCEQSDKALAILTIVIGAKRPLTLQELSIALAIEKRKTRDGKLKPLGEEAIEHSLRCLCGFLLSVSDSKVDLFHPTVKDFLLRSNDTSPSQSTGKWKHSLNKSSCDHTMAEICVQYLLSEDVKQGGIGPKNGSNEIHNQGNDREQTLQLESEDMGFVDYAATFWAEHYREAEIDRHDELEGLARDLCRVESVSYNIWFPIFWWRKTGRSSKIGYFTDIGVATFLGHKTIVNRLLRDNVKVDDNCGEFGFPLYVAAWTGDKGMSELLLEKGADINQVNGNHGNALYAALTNRKNDVVFLLLENGADIHIRGGMYGTILQAAAVRGDDKVVQALLERGADVNARCTTKEGYWPDALTAAAWNNHESTSRMLLEAGAEIVHTEYGSPLYGACFNNHEGLVRLFLEKKAEVNGRGGEFGHLLQAAAWNASTAIVQLLLDHGADIDAMGGYFGTALSAASYRGNEATVRLLLENGARQLEGGEFGSPSKAACENNLTHINLILLEALKQADSA